MMFELLTPADVERLAREKGLTMKAVAIRAGLSQSIFARWKAGKTEPSLVNYRRLVDVVASVAKAVEEAPAAKPRGRPSRPAITSSSPEAARITSSSPEAARVIVRLKALRTEEAA